MFSIILSTRLLKHSSEPSNLLLIPFSAVFLSFIIFFSSDWFFFIFSNYVEVLTVLIYLYPKFDEHLYEHDFDPFIR